MKKLTDASLTFLLCTLIIILTAFSRTAKIGALGGIELCEHTIIPSLLPILIICNLITKSKGAKVFERLFGSLISRLLKIPKAAAPAVILGAVGGYPSGAVLTLSLFSDGTIGKKTAKKIMLFNFSGGAAFIITAVGASAYSDVKTGALLFAVISVSNLAVALLSRKLPAEDDAVQISPPQFSDALGQAAEATVKALAVMSAYIILFCSLNEIVRPPACLLPLFEITSGIFRRNSPLPLPFCAFFLSFGGLCIHLQLFGFLKKMKTSYSDFLLGRLGSASLSYFLTKLYLYFFPQSSEVFSNLSQPVHSLSSGGITLSILMITGCAVIVFDIENKKIKLHSRV